MRWTDRLIDRPVLASVISILIFLLGLRSFYDLPTRQFPEITDTMITITTAYPGASAELMQGFVTTPIQQAVSAASGVDYVTSTSRQGVSSVKVKVRLGFSPEVAMSEVVAKVAEVKNELPVEATDPKIVKATGTTIATVYMAFNSASMTPEQISNYLSREMQPRLATIEGISETQILGGQTFAMRIWLDPLKMAARGLTADQVRNALLANNFLAAPGTVKGVFTISNIVLKSDLKDVDAFKELVVLREGKNLVRLKDVAEVELAAQSYDSTVTLQGEKAVFMGIKNAPDANPLEVVDRLRNHLPDLEKNLPAGLRMRIVYDSSKFIRSSIQEVITSLAEATFIVFAVVLLFLGSFRAVFIPVVTIPLSLVGVCTILAMLGFSINLLTLLAMVLAIGLVVDDAIVVVENVYRHLQEGRSPLEAAKQGTQEITGPVISMTLTLVAVYAPIAFMGGVTGALFKEFALTLAGSVVISGVIALTLSPMMCSKILRADMDANRFAQKIEKFFHRLTTLYEDALRQALNYRRWIAVGAFMTMGCIAFFLKVVPQELAPFEDNGYIMLITKGPQTATLDYMLPYSQQVSSLLTQLPENELAFTVSGLEDGPSSGMALTILKPWETRTRTAMAISPQIQRKLFDITGLNGFAFVAPALPGGGDGLPVQFVLTGMADYKVLFELMEKIKLEARKSGLFMVIDSDLAYNNPTQIIDIDASKSNLMGIQMKDIAATFNLLLGGNYINRFALEGRSYQVIPQVPREFRITPDHLGRYYVASLNGLVPLSTITKVREVAMPNRLTQHNQINSVTLQAINLPWITMGQCVHFFQKTAEKLLPKGFSYDFLSASRQYISEGKGMSLTFMFALVIIFLVLAAQFESWRDPLIVMFSVPLSLFGALYFLFQGFATLNIYTQVGLVTLVGLITKHGILITEFANKIREDRNLSKHEAVIQAASIRLRPILMTTAAMVIGLLPLLTAQGAGAVSRYHLGLVIVTGMLVGTFFTLFVVPTFYTYLAHQTDPIKQKERAKKE